MAKHERDVAKERHWRDILARQVSSGLCVRSFCQQEQLAESAFYAWRRTIRERDGAAQPASLTPKFVPAVIAPNAEREAFTLTLTGGYVLHMPGISIERLAELLLALDALGAR